MNKKILIIQGHPDSGESHLCHALDDAYRKGAKTTGNKLKRINVAELEFSILRSKKEWEKDVSPDCIKQAQKDMLWADHIVLLFPLWLGDMPALLKGFLEQIARPGFAFEEGENPFTHKKLKGRSARVVVTMGMPAVMYRWYFRSHSVKSLQRNILGFIGIKPINTTLIGLVENMKPATAKRWLNKLEKFGMDAG